MTKERSGLPPLLFEILGVSFHRDNTEYQVSRHLSVSGIMSVVHVLPGWKAPT